MKSTYRYIKYSIIILVLLFSSFSFSVNAEETSYTPKNGIVEIYSGISDTKENFYKIKNCSGFIVSNTESNCYIVTTYTGIDITSNEKNDCISKNNLSADAYGIDEAVKVVVNGDVEATLTTVNKSKQENFAILQSESVINEKTELKLGNTVENEESVFSLGFSNNTESTLNYDVEDVTKSEGEVESSAVALSNGTYIRHSASFDSGCSGGPLLNDDGYVVGLNDSNVATDGYYALNIESIKKILNNYSIPYSSYDLDQNYSQYTELYDKCKLMCESGNYTSESVEKLSSVLDEVMLEINDNPSNEDIESAIKALKEAKSKLIEKTPTIRIINYILLGVLIALLIWLTFLLIKNYKNTHPKRGNEINNGQNELLDDFEKTQQFDERQFYSAFKKDTNKKIAFLKGLESSILIKIDKSRFVLGSKIDEVDFAVDNKAVSRKHATIKHIDNKYYIFDENSVNGTYVNDVMVEDEGKVLNNNDVIALANEQFIFEER